MRRIAIAAALTTTMLMIGPVSAAEGAKWKYSGAAGPDHWAELDDVFSVCRVGRNQSPIDITDTIDGELPELEIDYPSSEAQIAHYGHTIQMELAPGRTLKIGDKAFGLKQLHFHAPSENTIEGKAYPLEAHFVHADQQGNLAVIGVMFEEGETHAELQKAWTRMPSEPSDKQGLPVIDLEKLLPEKRDYYLFNGSLTTPPCSEGVRWLVMKDAASLSAEQLERFRDAIGHKNNRPVQPVNARPVLD